MKSDLIDIAMQLHHETEKAVLVSDDGDRESAVWLPRSQIEIRPQQRRGIVAITLPEWLAVEKGLI